MSRPKVTLREPSGSAGDRWGQLATAADSRGQLGTAADLEKTVDSRELLETVAGSRRQLGTSKNSRKQSGLAGNNKEHLGTSSECSISGNKEPDTTTVSREHGIGILQWNGMYQREQGKGYEGSRALDGTETRPTYVCAQEGSRPT
jgi:hypothetical protein